MKLKTREYVVESHCTSVATGTGRRSSRGFSRHLLPALGLFVAGIGLGSFPARAQCLEKKLLAPDGGFGDQFGHKVALVPGWALCAAPYDDDIYDQSGAVYAFRDTGLDWAFAQKLKASDPAFGAVLGSALSASGSWMVATTPKDDPQGFVSRGSAHVYELQGGTWVHRQKILASDFTSIYQEFFGVSAAVRGTRMAIGEEDDDTKAPDAGSAYVFELQGSSWVEKAKVYASDWEVNGAFGQAVAVDGDRFVVGAPAHGNGAPNTNQGAAYVFERQGGSWIQLQKLLPSDPAQADFYGWAVAIEGDTILVGSGGHRHTPANSGAVYVFERQGAAFVQTQELLTWDNQPGDGVGWWIAIDGDLTVFSADTDSDLGLSSGSAYAFRRENGSWQQIGKMLAPDGQNGDIFGSAVAIAGRHALIGAQFDKDACPTVPGCKSGSAYVFELAPDAVQYCACPSQSPCGKNDNFGGCQSSRNMGGVLSACGTGSVATNDLMIEATWLPPNVVGILLMGGGTTSAPLGDGRLCVAAGGAGLFRLKPALSSGAGGMMSFYPIAASSTLPPGGAITPGSTWHFQCWFRDKKGPCATASNLTNALSVDFQP